MSTQRNKMIRSLNEIFIPKLRDMNFKGSFPHYRRTIDGKTNLLTFQFDKHGGGFIIELANWRGSEFKTHWGEVIPVNKLTAHDLNDRQRIYPNTLVEGNGNESWFRYDQRTLFIFGNKYNRLSKKVLKRLPVMEKYWNEI